MKTLRLFIVAFVAFVCVAPLFAQERVASGSRTGENWSSFYYVNVPLEKVFPHRLGYMVMYRRSGAELGRAYLPARWFSQAGGKGELLKLGTGKTWPYMTIFYKDGAFSHLRVFVRGDLSHPSWGYLPQGSNIDSQFDIEELRLEF